MVFQVLFAPSETLCAFARNDLSFGEISGKGAEAYLSRKENQIKTLRTHGAVSVAAFMTRDVPSLHKLSYTDLPKMKIVIASDYAGYEEKERLKPLLNELGIQFEDLGTISEKPVDYPDYARKVGAYPTPK